MLNPVADTMVAVMTGAWHLSDGVVCDVTAESVLVNCRIDEGVDVACRMLQPVEKTDLRVKEGDAVLIAVDPTKTRGVVLGRIEEPGISAAEPDVEIPDELVIKAGRSLTLEVGDGSITIREDGRILIKGKDLVSHAKRRNRIRGGSVEIN